MKSFKILKTGEFSSDDHEHVRSELNVAELFFLIFYMKGTIHGTLATSTSLHLSLKIKADY